MSNKILKYKNKKDLAKRKKLIAELWSINKQLSRLTATEIILNQKKNKIFEKLEDKWKNEK